MLDSEAPLADQKMPTFLNRSDGCRVRLQKIEILIGKIPDVLRQLPIVKPELRGGEMLQRGVQRPASKSSSPRLPAASSQPALMSSSI
jgi:hypothetical protein